MLPWYPSAGSVGWLPPFVGGEYTPESGARPTALATLALLREDLAGENP